MRPLYLLGALGLACLALELTNAQNSALQPVAPTPAVVAKSPAPNDAEAAANAKLLQDMITANDALLKKQEATLQNLDDLQKAAQEIKIFSKRG